MIVHVVKSGDGRFDIADIFPQDTSPCPDTLHLEDIIERRACLILWMAALVIALLRLQYGLNHDTLFVIQFRRPNIGIC
jgi:hypothetical protein